MNTVNFSALDFSPMLNKRQNDWNQTANSIGQMGKAFNEYYDRKVAEEERKRLDAERKRKWDSILEIEKQGQDAIDAEQGYNDSLQKQNELQGYIDTANGVNSRNAELRKQFNEVYNGTGEGANIRNSSGNEGSYDEKNGVYNMTRGGSTTSYPVQGIRDGMYEHEGLSYDPIGRDKALRDINGKIGQDIDTEGLRWKLEHERTNGLRYRKAGENADMYRDPRYRTALATAKANNDPSVLHEYVSQWQSEAPQRASRKTMEEVRKIPLDVSGYGKTAEMLYSAMQGAQTPEEQRNYMSMLYGVMSQVDQQRLQKSEENDQRTKDNKFAVAMRDYNNTDWSLADIGERYGRLDTGRMNRNQVAALQREIGVNPTGRIDSATQARLQEAREAYARKFSMEKDLSDRFGASRVYGAINDAKQAKYMEAFLRNNRPVASSGSGW